MTSTRTRVDRFKVGDIVWLYVAHSGVARKLDKRWEVTEIKGPVNVVVKNTDGR